MRIYCLFPSDFTLLISSESVRGRQSSIHVLVDLGDGNIGMIFGCGWGCERDVKKLPVCFVSGMKMLESLCCQFNLRTVII